MVTLEEMQAMRERALALDDPMQWILFLVALVAFALVWSWFYHRRSSRASEAEEYWRQRESSGELDEELDHELIVEEIMQPTAPIDLEQRLAQLARLTAREKDLLAAMERDRADATFVDADGYHYLVPAGTPDDEPVEAVETKYEEALEEIDVERDAIHGSIIEYLHRRRIELEAFRDSDPDRYRREDAELERLEARFHEWDASDDRTAE